MAKVLISRVVIKKPKVVFKKFKKTTNVGYAYPGEHRVEIAINQTDAELCGTLFHELCHLMLPDLRESQIIKIELLYGKALYKAVLRLKRKWKISSPNKPK